MGLCLVEYTRAPEGLHIIDQHFVSRSIASPADAADGLARAMQLERGEGAHLAMAIRGFGSEYLIVMLPPAADDVLRSVVGRELARMYPELEQPVYGFARAGFADQPIREPPTQPGQPRQEMLVGAVPGKMARALSDELRARGISLDHLTVLPQALQQLYSEIDDASEPTGVVLMLPGGPLIGFFLDAELRFVVEPPLSLDETPAHELEILLEQLERGSLYLRHTFRGAEMGRVLVSADPSRQPALMASLAEKLGIEVREFGTEVNVPEPLIALGAVRDAEGPSLINLSPLAESPAVRERRAKERTLMLGADVLVALAILWAVASVWSLKQLSDRIATGAAQVQQVAPQVASMRSVAEARRDYVLEAAYLDSRAADRAAVRRVLAAVAAATRSDVQLEELKLTRNGASWAADVVAVSTGPSTASALFGVDRFYRTLPATITLADRQLVDLVDISAQAGGGTTLRFHITFAFHPGTALQ